MVYFFHGPMPSQQLAMSRKSPEPAQPLTSRSFNCFYIDIFERTFDFNRFSMQKIKNFMEDKNPSIISKSNYVDPTINYHEQPAVVDCRRFCCRNPPFNEIIPFSKTMGKKQTNQTQTSAFRKLSPSQIPQSQDHTFLNQCHNEITTNPAVKNDSTPQPNLAHHTQKIKKGRKLRVYNPEDRFLPEHIKKYYLFPFHYSTLFPYFKISWKYWKPNSVYKKMAQFLSNIPNHPNKTSIQCKSFDQRMKDINYVTQSEPQQVDLLQASFCHLKGSNLDKQDFQVIERYLNKMTERSSYIQFLQNQFPFEDEELSAEEVKSEVDLILPEEKKEETSIDSNNQEGELIFNQFLDIGG